MAQDAATDTRLIDELRAQIRELQAEKTRRWRRRVSLGDLLTERDDNARAYGFGEGTTCYDNVLILGDVRVGNHTWIGPNVILDGSGGGLEIGDYCSLNAGVQIYTHDSVAWAISGGAKGYEHAPVKIGSGVFIGPNAVIAMGVTIGDRAIIGALSFVNNDIPAGAKAFGQPAKVRSGAAVKTSAITACRRP